MITRASRRVTTAPALVGAPGLARLAMNLSPFDVLAGLLVGGTAVIAGWIALGGATADPEGIVAGVASPVADLAAAALLAGAALRAQRDLVSRAWALLGLALVVYAVGDGLWAWIAIVDHGETFPSAADGAYVAFYPIAGVALLLFPAPARRRTETVRLLIDSGIVLLGGGMLVWQSLLGPALATPDTDPLKSLLTFGYPVGDLVLLFAVATIALRRPADLDPGALTALVAGMAMMFIADVAYGELDSAGTSAKPGMDLAYLASSAVIGVSGWLAMRSTGGPITDEEPAGLSRSLIYLPYAGLAAGFGVLLAASQASGDGPLVNLAWGAAGLVMLVLVRQELVNRENSRLLSEAARRGAEARYQALERDGSDSYVLVDAAGIVTFASATTERILDLDRSALTGSPIVRYAHADDAAALETLIADSAAGRPVGPLEWRLWTRSGAWRQVETIPANLLADPALGAIVLTTRDVRERTALKRQAEQAGLRDHATGLPNRRQLFERTVTAVEGSRETGKGVSVIQLDLNGFKRVNGSVGQASGDQVLREVAARIAAIVRPADTVARVGGDEFAVLLPGLDAAEAGVVTERIRRRLRDPMSVGGVTFELTASIGIGSLDAAPELDAAGLLRSSDIALTVARERGPNHVAVFERSMVDALEGRLHLESDLRAAIARDELVLEYQPIVELATAELVGAEALVRWNHPSQGRLPPSTFVPLAEEAGLIGAIGTWVLERACRDVALWARVAHDRVPRVSVNLAAPQIADPQLAWTVQSTLAAASASPGWLTVEVTESMLIQDTAQALEQLHAIRALGVRISVDDFGTGYSSLSYLQEFPLNHIKIDRSFVTPLDDPANGSGLARAIVEISRALGMSTVAEGIETARQRDRLLAMGCEFGQGFLFGRPMASEEIAARSAEATSRLGRARQPVRSGRRPARRPATLQGGS